jgi:hypothetical protein
MKANVGLNGASSPQDRLFACPADTFYYEYDFGYVPKSRHEQSFSDYSSYSFNGANLFPSPSSLGHDLFLGIGGRQLTSIKNPVRTVLVAENPAFQPYSWHDPQPPPAFCLPPKGEVQRFNGAKVQRFNDAKDMLGFVDGHVSYSKIYWNSGIEAICYEPPAEYDYQWSGN